MIFEFNGGPLDGVTFRMPAIAGAMVFTYYELEGLKPATQEGQGQTVERPETEVLGYKSGDTVEYIAERFEMQGGEKDHENTVARMVITSEYSEEREDDGTNRN